MISRLEVLKWWVVFRSSISGQYVSRAYAFAHPDTTVSEKRWRK